MAISFSCSVFFLLLTWIFVVVAFGKTNKSRENNYNFEWIFVHCIQMSNHFGLFQFDAQIFNGCVRLTCFLAVGADDILWMLFSAGWEGVYRRRRKKPNRTIKKKIHWIDTWKVCHRWVQYMLRIIIWIEIISVERMW